MSKHILDRREFLQIRRRHRRRRRGGRRARPRSSPATAPGRWTLGALGPHEAEVLLQMTRQLYPHDGLGDIYYAEVVEALDAKAKADARARGAGQERGRRARQGHGRALPRALRRLPDRGAGRRWRPTPFFQTVRGHTVVALYNNQVLWAEFGYQGSSWQDGGYLLRGFQDIGWTLAARRRGQPAAVSGLREEATSWRPSNSTTIRSW